LADETLARMTELEEELMEEVQDDEGDEKHGVLTEMFVAQEAN
jgi:hypothetical protein